MALAEYVELFDKLEKRIGDARPVNAMLRASWARRWSSRNKTSLNKWPRI